MLCNNKKWEIWVDIVWVYYVALQVRILLHSEAGEKVRLKKGEN